MDVFGIPSIDFAFGHMIWNTRFVFGRCSPATICSNKLLPFSLTWAFPKSAIVELSSSFSDLVELAIQLRCSPIIKHSDSTPSHWLIYRYDRLIFTWLLSIDTQWYSDICPIVSCFPQPDIWCTYWYILTTCLARGDRCASAPRPMPRRKGRWVFGSASALRYTWPWVTGTASILLPWIYMDVNVGHVYTVDIDLIAGTCCNFVEPHSYPFGWFESESRFWIGWFLDEFKPPRCDLQWPKVSGVSTWVQGDPTWQGFRVATGWPLIKIIKVKDGW